MSRYNQSYGATGSKANNYNAKPAQYGQRSKPVPSELSSMEIQIMKQSFGYFDTNRSGRISGREFKDIVRSLGYTASDEEIVTLMRTYDYDGDGHMDFNEFLAMAKHLKSEGFDHGKKALEQQIKHAFSILDVDGDQYLTPKELEYVLCNTGDRLSRTEFNDFMQLFDKDKDGKVSCQELIDVICSSLEDHLRKLF